MSNLNVSEEKIKQLLELEKRELAKRTKHYAYAQRRNVKLALLAKKAMEKGIVVTNEEIDDYIARNK
jgi:urease accessory protein UreE